MGVLKSSKKPKNGVSRTTFDSWVDEDMPKSRQSSMQSFLTVNQKRIRVRSPPTTVSQATPETPPTPATAPPVHLTEAPLPESTSGSLGSQSQLGASARDEKNDQESSKKSFQQMYLDLGQRDFSKRTLCMVCGMMYDAHGVREDIEQHNRVCKDFVQGVPFHASQARVVAKDDTCSIVEVREEEWSSRGREVKCGVNSLYLTVFFNLLQIRPSDSYALRKKVMQVRTIVDDELGYVPSDLDTALRSAYLYIRKRRVVGLVTAEVIDCGYALQSNFERSTHPRKAMIGVHHMWVHSKFRKQGIATRLVDAVREKMIFGLVVPPELVAFSSPTEAGVKFAKRYVNQASRNEAKDVLVYDCS